EDVTLKFGHAFGILLLAKIQYAESKQSVGASLGPGVIAYHEFQMLSRRGKIRRLVTGHDDSIENLGGDGHVSDPFNAFAGDFQRIRVKLPADHGHGPIQNSLSIGF